MWADGKGVLRTEQDLNHKVYRWTLRASKGSSKGPQEWRELDGNTTWKPHEANSFKDGDDVELFCHSLNVGAYRDVAEPPFWAPPVMMTEQPVTTKEPPGDDGIRVLQFPWRDLAYDEKKQAEVRGRLRPGPGGISDMSPDSIENVFQASKEGMWKGANKPPSFARPGGQDVPDLIEAYDRGVQSVNDLRELNILRKMFGTEDRETAKSLAKDLELANGVLFSVKAEEWPRLMRLHRDMKVGKTKTAFAIVVDYLAMRASPNPPDPPRKMVFRLRYV